MLYYELFSDARPDPDRCLDKMGTKLDPVQDRLDYVVPDQVKKFLQYF